MANPMDASEMEHSLDTESDFRHTTEELVGNGTQRGEDRHTPAFESNEAGFSPPIMLHSHLQWDEGSLPSDAFAALRASAAVKPEESASPTEGAAGGHAHAAGHPRDSLAFASLEGVPVFGNEPPSRTPAGTRPSRPFAVDPSPNSDRAIRRQNAEGFTFTDRREQPGVSTAFTNHAPRMQLVPAEPASMPMPLPDVSNLPEGSATTGCLLPL